MADPSAERARLRAIDLGATVGTTVTRDDYNAGTPHLIDDHSAYVDIIKDPSFPEGYRVRTAFPIGGSGQVILPAIPWPKSYQSAANARFPG